MVNPLQIPGYQAQPDINFSSLAQLPQIYQQAQDRANVQQTLATLGQGGQVDPMQLVRSGNLNLAQLGFNLQQRQQEQQRQATQDAYSREKDQRDFALRKDEIARAQRNSDRSYGLQERQFTENQDYSPQERAQMAGQYGIQPGTPEFKTFVLTGGLPASTNTTVQAQVDQRRAAAESLGLKPDNPGYQSFVLTGKMPREDAQPLTAGDKEAIRTADDAVLANKSAIDSLNRAKDLSKQAFTGPTAGVRGYAASFLGEGSDTGKAGIATENLTNEVMTNALGQLKAIFGGNPTEGERKIMLDMQGSVTKPDSVRQAIFDRAINAAQNRLKFNQQRADALRGNTYYKPQSGQQQPAQGRPISEAEYNSLPSGATFTAPDGSQRVKP